MGERRFKASCVARVTTVIAMLIYLTTVLSSGLARAASGTEEKDRVWPVVGPTGERPAVVRGWEPPATAWGAGHRGVDLVARGGARVRAVAAGRVSFAGRVTDRGVLSIELLGIGPRRPPLRTTYQPVRALVAEGDRVTAGQVVGVLDAGPFHCRGGCLHWGLLRGERYLDPLALLPARQLHRGPSRLLPVFGVPLPAEDQTAVPLAHGHPAPTTTLVVLPAAVSALPGWRRRARGAHPAVSP